MDIKFEELSYSHKDKEEIDNLMIRQFPSEEYISIDKQLEIQSLGYGKVLAVKIKDSLLGLVTILVSERLAYIFFITVDDRYQNQGYGSYILKNIKDRYKDKVIVADIEIIDSQAHNIIQRRKRKSFYIRNGFKETAWGINYLGYQYELLSTSNNFCISEVKEILDKLPVDGSSRSFFKL